MAFFSSLAAAIDSYTGLSPPAFFTILALMVGAYRLVSAFFVYPDEESAAKRSLAPQMPPPPEAFSPPPQPVQLGDITLEDLKAYDGSDPNKPLLVAIKGQVYDVSIGRYCFLRWPPFPFGLLVEILVPSIVWCIQTFNQTCCSFFFLPLLVI